jgi:hypothetical protein
MAIKDGYCPGHFICALDPKWFSIKPRPGNDVKTLYFEPRRRRRRLKNLSTHLL